MFFHEYNIDNSFGRHFSSKIGHEDDEDHDDDHDAAADDDDDDQADDADGEGDGDEKQHAQDVEDLFAGGNRLSMKKFGQKRRSVECIFFWPAGSLKFNSWFLRSVGGPRDAHLSGY